MRLSGIAHCPMIFVNVITISGTYLSIPVQTSPSDTNTAMKGPRKNVFSENFPVFEIIRKPTDQYTMSQPMLCVISRPIISPDCPP